MLRNTLTVDVEGHHLVADKGSLRPGAGIQITWEAVWVLEGDSSDGEGQRGPYHFVCREHDTFQSLKNKKNRKIVSWEHQAKHCA